MTPPPLVESDPIGWLLNNQTDPLRGIVTAHYMDAKAMTFPVHNTGEY